MILRDPVHGLVSFDGDAERIVSRLLETRELQRLRYVRQVGLASLVFPGAEHSRFAHALGAAHVMVRLLGRIERPLGTPPVDQRVTAEDARDAIAAALLHDLGHGPFSHLFEEVLPRSRSHERWTVDILRHPETEVHRALEELSTGMSERVASLLVGTHRLRYLSRAISGVLDVDRCDYLLRDSHMTGVRYGLYDLDWLLRALSFVPFESAERSVDGSPASSDEWVIAIEGRKGLPPIEGFFLGRAFMYRQVYHHKATRAADCLARSIVARVAWLVEQGVDLPALPPAVRAAITGEPIQLHQYVELDDARLLYCFSEWERSRADLLLSELCGRFRARRLPKSIPLPVDAATHDAPDARWELAFAEARRRVAARGFDPNFHAWLDVTRNTTYEERSGSATEAIWVSLRHQPLRRLGEVSSLLCELANKVAVTPRLVVPAECRDEVARSVERIAR